MTLSREYVRVSLYGCSHKPKFSGFGPPSIGDEILCHACNRGRIVLGVVSDWSIATLSCRQCVWTFVDPKKGKRDKIRIAHTHADVQRHYVTVNKDGYITLIRPSESEQLLLIDDLLMPD